MSGSKWKRSNCEASTFHIGVKVRLVFPGDVVASDFSAGGVLVGLPSETLEGQVVKPLTDDGVWIHVKEANGRVFRCKPTALEIIQARPAHVSIPSQVMKQMWLSRNDNGDVNVTVGGEDIPAHGCVLAAVSCVFAAALKGSMKESVNKCIVIPDASKETLQGVLEIIYTGHAPTSLDVISALELARKYMMIQVAEHLGQQAIEMVNTTNVGAIAKVLKDFDAMEGSQTHFIDALLDAHGSSREIMKSIVQYL